MASPNQIEIPPPSLDDVLYHRPEGENFATITLNRPVVLNAVDWSIRRRLWWALNQAMDDEEVRAVVLTGAGRAFCSGGDLQSKPPDDGEPTPDTMDIFMAIWQMPKPVIAAVRGYAVGQGVQFAGICDLTIASEDARFGEIQIRHGFGPPLLITPFLVGMKQAKELLLLGDMVDAPTALRMGLVNRVVPGDQLIPEAEALARKIAGLRPSAVALNKALVNRVYELNRLSEALAYRSDPAIQAITGGTITGPGTDPHLQVLREQGWEAFKASRDVLYKGTAQ